MWFCPTYQRPEALAELAETWEKYESGKKLVVRVWSGDKFGKDYAEREWPESWEFYVSDKELFTPAMNEFFGKYPDEPHYGFIADDIRLTQEGSLAYLENLAEPFFIAYPNDTIQRERLCTHYCVGGDLVRTMGWFSPPFLQHGYTDQVWKLLGQGAGLLRYAPQVVFYHKHFLRNRTAYDEGYAKIYAKDGAMVSEMVTRDHEIFQKYVSTAAGTDIKMLRKGLDNLEQAILEEAGYEYDGRPEAEIAIHSDETKSVLPAGDVRGGMGGRHGAAGGDDSAGEACGVHRPGDSGDGEGAALHGENMETRVGLPSGGCPWVIEPREYKYPDAKVVVAVPSGGEWKSGTAVSAILMVNDFMQYGLPGLRSRTIHVNSTESSMLVSNRHNAVKVMLKVGASHLLFVDSDMKFPPWALRRMLSHDVPVVAANCTKRAFPVTGTALDFEGQVVDSRGKKGLEPVRQVGGAFMLIRRDVLERLRPPLFLMEWVPDMEGYCGEDIYFSQLLQAAGVDILVDHELSVAIGHVGSFTYGHGHVEHKVPDWMPGTAVVVQQ